MKRDILGIIEKAYQIEPSHEEWLAGMAREIHEVVGAGLGLMSFEYEVTTEDRVLVGRSAEVSMPEGIAPMMQMALEAMPGDFVRRTFVRCEGVTQSQGGDEIAREQARASMESLASFGWRDVLMVGGVDPSSRGVYFGAWLPQPTRLSGRARAT